MRVILLFVFFLTGMQTMYAQFVFPTSHTTNQTFGCIGCSITNPASAYDNEMENFASLRVGLSLASAVTLDMVFSPAIPSNSVISLVVEDPGNSFSLASDVSYDLLNGSSVVGNSGWNMASYPGSSTRYVLSTITNSSFNHMRITLSGVLTTNKVLNVYEVASSSAIPLPVQFLSFTGSVQEENIHLAWTTLSEINHQGFEVQKSLDGIHWTSLYWLLKKNTAGHPAVTYHYTDLTPEPGVNYYRLRQTDKNGTATYSKIIQVPYQTGTAIRVYPNPISYLQPLLIDFEADLQGIKPEVALYDQTGRWYDRQTLTTQRGHASYHLPKGLTAGLYVLHIRTGIQEVRQKVWLR